MTRSSTPDTGFDRSVAIIIGIDAYETLTPLTGAVNDAHAVAAALARQQYEVTRLVTPADTTCAALKARLASLADELESGDRLLIYFAGHGVADQDDGTPQGYLAAIDAGRDDFDAYLPMAWLYDLLGDRLKCRHRLLVLDCCFAGSFAWTATRFARPAGHRRLYRHRHRRFVGHPAVQVLTSSAANQTAADVAVGMTIGHRTRAGRHSPFAAALLDGISPKKEGEAAQRDKRVITATALYLHIRDAVETGTDERQTPGLWPVKGHGRGEYVFWPDGAPAPGDLPEDPRLDDAANPWPGLRAYRAEQRALFCGRDAEIAALRARVEDPDGSWVVAVVAASGVGKSSLVQAGLLPRLTDAGRRVIGPLRPGAAPLETVNAIETALADGPGLVIIDQLEEVFTQGGADADRQRFFERLVALEAPDVRLLLTLRSDYADQVEDTALGPALADGRFTLDPMERAALRAVIEGPAEHRVLYFEPAGLVDTLVDDVVALPGGLPLLSFTLAEMYRAYVRGDADDRTLTTAHYRALGGVVGALRTRASALYDATPDAERATVRRLMLRLVARDGQSARRRASTVELTFADPAEQRRMDAVIERFVDGRLLVRGAATGADGEPEDYVEPAHDVLVRGWSRIASWLTEARETLPLQQALWRAAHGWADAGAPPGRLWDDDPRLPQARIAALRPALNALEARFVDASAARRRRRITALVAAVIAVVLALSGLTVYALYEADRADANADVAEAKRIEAEAQTRIAQAATRRAVAERELAIDPTAAALLLAEAPPAPGSPQHHVLVEAAHQPWLTVARIDAGAPLTGAAFHPDGQMVITAATDGTVRRWRVDGSALPPMGEGHLTAARSLVISPDGRWAATGSADAEVRLWPLTGGAPRVLGAEGPVLDLAFDPPGQSLTATTDYGVIERWSVPDRRTLPMTQHCPGGWCRVQYGPRGDVMIAGTVSALRLPAPGSAGRPVRFSPLIGDLFAAEMSPSGRFVATRAGAETALWSAATPEGPVRTWQAGAGEPLFAFHPVLASLAFVEDRVGVRVVETRRDRLDEPGRPPPESMLQGHTASITALAFMPDGVSLAAGAADGTVRIWPLHDRRPATVLRGHRGAITALDFGPDGALLTAAADGVRIWRAPLVEPATDEAGAPLAGRPGWQRPRPLLAPGWAVHRDPVGVVRMRPTDRRAPWRRLAELSDGDVALSPDGAHVAIGDATGRLRVWRTAEPSAPIERRLCRGEVELHGFAPGSSLLAACGVGLFVVPLDGGAPTRVPGGEHRESAPVISPDGRWVALHSYDNAVHLVPTDRRLAPEPMEDTPILGAHFDPAGRRVLLIVYEDVPLLMAVEGDAPGRSLEHPDPLMPTTVAFTPDGAQVVLGLGDGRVLAWRTRRDDPASRPLWHHGEAVVSAVFDADGRRLLTAGADGTVHLGALDGERPLVLRHDGPLVGAVFGDPTRGEVIALATDGTIRRWLTEPAAASRWIERQVGWCWPVAARVARLGETEADAQAAAEACRRRSSTGR